MVVIIKLYYKVLPKKEIHIGKALHSHKSVSNKRNSLYRWEIHSLLLKRAHFISVRQQTSILLALSKINDFPDGTGGSRNRM